VIERDYSHGKSSTPVWKSGLAGGRELVQTSEPAPSGALSFRAQADSSFARYQKLSGDTWRVLQTDGSVLHFGEALYGAAEFNDYKPITRRVDRFGNEVRYHWIPTLDNGMVLPNVELRIERIEYSVNDGASLTAHAKVWFDYGQPLRCQFEAPPIGSRSSFRHSTPRYFGYRPIDRIYTQVADGAGFRTVREIHLTYKDTTAMCAGQEPHKRLLTSIQETAYAPDATPTTLPAVTVSCSRQLRWVASRRSSE
jgi:hypothetical protein